MPILLEIIANSAEDCAVIERHGGERIELCTALALGGLTPPAGLVAAARAATSLPIMMMLRPREGGFCYTNDEFTTLLLDLEFGLAQHVDGFVFGCLCEDGTIDRARTRQIVEMAGTRQTVFHRAFDVTPDPLAALETLIDLGVTRVLTSGQQPTALAGAGLIRALVEQAAGRIEILPGSGVKPENVADLLRRTGATQVHASASGTRLDPSTQARPGLGFGGQIVDSGEGYRVAVGEVVAALRKGVDEGVKDEGVRR